jgi:hypothetical protein
MESTIEGSGAPPRASRDAGAEFASEEAEAIMNLISVGAVAAAAMIVAAVPPSPAVSAELVQDQKVTLIGCAVRGESGDDGFLLVNNVERTTVGAISPTPGGVRVDEVTMTALKPARVLYWLDDDDDVVQRFVGHMVEVTGEVEGDIERGNIKAERENGMIELEIDAAGRKATVKVPDVPSAIGSDKAVSDREKELPYVVQKLDVQSARSVSPTCR